MLAWVLVIGCGAIILGWLVWWIFRDPLEWIMEWGVPIGITFLVALVLFGFLKGLTMLGVIPSE